MAAADEAIADSGWAPEDEQGQRRTGVQSARGSAAVDHRDTAVELEQKGPRRVSPFFIPSR